jgi:translation elongation factor EF-Ts
LLADTSFWSDVATEMPGEIVAAVPSRDVLLFCRSEVRCTTDFVARTHEFQTLSSELALQVAGAGEEDLLPAVCP